MKIAEYKYRMDNIDKDYKIIYRILDSINQNDEYEDIYKKILMARRQLNIRQLKDYELIDEIDNAEEDNKCLSL